MFSHFNNWIQFIKIRLSILFHYNFTLLLIIQTGGAIMGSLELNNF